MGLCRIVTLGLKKKKKNNYHQPEGFGEDLKNLPRKKDLNYGDIRYITIVTSSLKVDSRDFT